MLAPRQRLLTPKKFSPKKSETLLSKCLILKSNITMLHSKEEAEQPGVDPGELQS